MSEWVHFFQILSNFLIDLWSFSFGFSISLNFYSFAANVK